MTVVPRPGAPSISAVPPSMAARSPASLGLLGMRERAREVGGAFFAPLRARFIEAWRDMSDEDRAVVARFLRVSIDATVAVRAGLVRDPKAD